MAALPINLIEVRAMRIIQYKQPQTCPRCGKLSLNEDSFCEHCLFNLLENKFLDTSRELWRENGG